VVTRTLSLTGLYEPVEGGWVQARIEELPGVITAGRTYEEARELLLDALREYLLAGGDEAPSAIDSGEARREPLLVSLRA
jgi:predicted RNase H-like HicB family nuclease